MIEPASGPRGAGGLGIWAKLYAQRSSASVPDATYPTATKNENQTAQAVSSAPMASADLVFGDDGRVAWDRVWADFCALALIGGPSHRGAMLEAPTVEEVASDLGGYEWARDELDRGLALTTHWTVERDGPIGWIGLVCPDHAAAIWMARAIRAENVAARSAGAIVFVPAGPAFELEGEIKNVVTAVAKAWHYWAKHGMR